GSVIASHTCSGVALMKICSTCTGFSVMTACSNTFHLLCVTFDRHERRGPTFRVLAYPPVVDLLDRHRIEVAVLLATDAAGHDEPGVLEHAEMLHHPEPRHVAREYGGELVHGLPLVREEPVEDPSPRWIRERLEYLIHLGETICDHSVTCQVVEIVTFVTERTAGCALTPGSGGGRARRGQGRSSRTAS